MEYEVVRERTRLRNEDIWYYDHSNGGIRMYKDGAWHQVDYVPTVHPTLKDAQKKAFDILDAWSVVCTGCKVTVYRVDKESKTELGSMSYDSKRDYRKVVKGSESNGISWTDYGHGQTCMPRNVTNEGVVV